MKILNFILAIIFMILASMKINDPQPIVWILMYGTMAVICIMAMFGVYYKSLIVLVMIPVLYYASLVHVDAREWVHAGGTVNHLEAKDFFSLVFAFFVLLFQGIRSFFKG